MHTLLPLLEKVKKTHNIVLIYLQEAHPDDLWPMGYGIKSTNTVEERISNCKNFLNRWPDMQPFINAIFVDNMNNDFNNVSGAWPEAYIFTDK